MGPLMQQNGRFISKAGAGASLNRLAQTGHLTIGATSAAQILYASCATREICCQETSRHTMTLWISARFRLAWELGGAAV